MLVLEFSAPMLMSEPIVISILTPLATDLVVPTVLELETYVPADITTTAQPISEIMVTNIRSIASSYNLVQAPSVVRLVSLPVSEVMRNKDICCDQCIIFDPGGLDHFYANRILEESTMNSHEFAEDLPSTLFSLQL